MKELMMISAIFFSVLTFGQNDKEKIFTIGISEGIGGTHCLLSPTIDFSIYKSKLKFTSIPLYPRFLSIGLTQDIKRLRKENLSWIVSLNYSQSNDYYWADIRDMRRSFKNYSLISGVKLKFLKRLESNFQLGILCMDLTSWDWNGNPSRTYNLLPYGDLSLSVEFVRIFRQNKK